MIRVMEVLMPTTIQYLVLVVILLLSTYLYPYLNRRDTTNIKRNKTETKSAAAGGGFKVYPFLGTLPEFLRNRHRFLEWTTQVLSRCPTNTAVFRRPGKIHGVITANPQNVEHMLKTNFHNYPKGDRFTYLLRDFLGQGIFNSDGELWKLQRKTASYEFNTKSLRNFVLENVVAEMETRLLPILEEYASHSSFAPRPALDLQDVLERFAFDNVCKLAFDIDPACLAAPNADASSHVAFMRAFEDAASLSSGRFMYAFPIFWRIKKLLGVGSERRLSQAIRTVHTFADTIILQRSTPDASCSSSRHDLLSRFIANELQANSSSSSSPELLRDIVISFILAGRDTTSSALSWFFWLLSSRPHVSDSILRELKTVRMRHGTEPGEPFTFDQLRDMQYLQAAISESMRLYPPVPVDTKACLRDDILPDGTFVGRDWFITYHTYAMGRMDTIWGNNSHEYVPERWLNDAGICRQESPFRFPVFHAGPRTCLGREMAYIQMKSIAASIIEGFEIQVVNGDKPPEHLLSLTLRMKAGLPVTLAKRRHL